MKSNDFKEEIHFYYNESGLMVLTEKYHLERDYCCGNGCKHCPYKYTSVTDVEKQNTLKKEEEIIIQKPLFD